ncbi:zinc ABC transporter substrate-binding protein [Clostridium sediminicola]|uniref:metal ABC transporter solute-binding protein, Zn/Mn family n=1 Tax=Clostridium sediminicola TaxID=3114879 RepID=UPI0031F2247F
MKQVKNIIFLIIITIVISLSGCKESTSNKSNKKVSNEEKITVAVSIVPEETFVRAVAGDNVNIITMIPPGYSPANYQPTPKQMAKLSEAKMYFSIGVSTEEVNILPSIRDFNKDILIISLDNKVEEVYPHLYFQSVEHSAKDPHIWLSPKRVILMIECIRDELIKVDSNNKNSYIKNSEEYIAKIKKIDEEIRESLNNIKNNSFIIYHPSFGYFAKDYGLNMIAIEDDGKESTVRKIQEVIDFAKKEKIKVVFYQEEFDSKQAETIAEEIGGVTVKVAPLAKNYLGNLEEIKNKFREVLQ